MNAAWLENSLRDLSRLEQKTKQCLVESQRLIGEIQAGIIASQDMINKTRQVLYESRLVIEGLKIKR